MTEKGNDNKQFDAEDIRRYLSGEMSDADRHALEKSALDDPFLADAIEGMESRLPIDNLAQDLASLQTRLETRIEPKQKAIVAPFYKVAAAAIVFLLAGSLSILYFLNNGKEAGPDTMVSDVSIERASNEKADSGIAFSPALPVIPDSSMQLAPPGVMTDEQSRATTMHRPDPVVISPESSGPQAFLKSKAPSNLSEPQTNLKRTDDADFSRLQAEESRLENRSGSRVKPDSLLQADEIRENTSLVPAKTDTLTGRGFAMKQSTAEASPALRSMNVGVEQTKYEPSKQPLPSEQVLMGKVSGVSLDTKKTTRRPDLFSIEPLFSDTTTFGPVSSWSRYADLINPVATPGKRPQETIVQFRINPQGQPQDLRILKTGNRSSSAEIIRLIQNGPLWQVKPGSDSTVKVLIRF